MKRIGSAALLGAALWALSGCSGGGEAANDQAAAGAEAPAGAPAIIDEAALANEAAADEAADIEQFGGNAAAGETGNTAAGETNTQ